MAPRSTKTKPKTQRAAKKKSTKRELPWEGKSQFKKSRMSSGRSSAASGGDPRLIITGRFSNSWSFSRYNSWRECPRKFALEKINKLCVAPPSRAIQRGTMIHMRAEAYLRGQTKGLPDELKQFSDEFKNLKRMGASPEREMVITEDEKPTRGDDWNNAWLRTKIDAQHYFAEEDVLLLIDFKTGRYDPKEGQGELYACMSKFFPPQDSEGLPLPPAQNVEVELWFLDEGKPEKYSYTRRELDVAWKKWRERADRFLADRTFSPKPNKKCDWCTYNSSKEMSDGTKGPCHAWKERAA